MGEESKVRVTQPLTLGSEGEQDNTNHQSHIIYHSQIDMTLETQNNNQKRLIILAIDDAWRDLRNTVNSIRADDALKPGACGEWSVNQILYHITAWEKLLINALLASDKDATQNPQNAYHSEDADAFNAKVIENMSNMTLREVMEKFDMTHRHLRDILEQCPSEVFAPQHPKRKLIDEHAFLHYEEHTAHIAAWMHGGKKR